MTWFSLPPPDTKAVPPFASADGAEQWLSSQPQANVPAMQAALARQLERLNQCALPPRDRYRILEVLRKPVLAVEAESARRFESRPLPLSPGEAAALNASLALWRALGTGYLHCVRACLDGSPELATRAAKVAHRAITCLRMEQLDALAAGVEPGPDFWRRLHGLLAAGEQLGALHSAIEDPGPGETRESTLGGHYAMALLLHLARPAELSRAQFAAVCRWLARWREMAPVRATPPGDDGPRALAIDLAQDAPFHLAPDGAGIPRWLEIEGVLGKLKSRLRDLREGASPESLRLGNSLTAEGCSALLQQLHHAFQNPPAPWPADRREAPAALVAVGIEAIHRELGGRPVGEGSAPSATTNRRVHEQIAIFGRVVERTDEQSPSTTERWRILGDHHGDLVLARDAAEGGRITARGIVALRHERGGPITLAILRALTLRDDGRLYAIARRLPGSAAPAVALGQERQSARALRLPALLLISPGHDHAPASLLLPAGTLARAAQLHVDGQTPGALIERGGDFEWVHAAPR